MRERLQNLFQVRVALTSQFVTRDLILLSSSCLWNIFTIFIIRLDFFHQERETEMNTKRMQAAYFPTFRSFQRVLQHFMFANVLILY